jgi:hypothetical protein
MQALLGTYTTATLPSASSVIAGTQAYTTDAGLQVSNGKAWGGSTINRTLLGKIRAALAASAGGQNVAQRAPLLAPATWAATTGYAQGQVVTNTGGGAGNLYICATPFATSAGSGGPTGQGSALIVDGGVTWQYFGPVLTAANQAGAPTVTANVALSTPGAKTWFYANPLATSNSATLGDPGFFLFDGGFWQANVVASLNVLSCWNALGAATGSAQTVGGIASAFWNNGTGSVTFWSDAPKLHIGSIFSGGGSGYLEIDDMPVSDSHFIGGPAAGTVIDWTAVGGRKTRKYRVWCQSFLGVAVYDAISQVWAYQPPNAYKIAWSGDSISANVGSSAGPFGCGNYDAVRRFTRLIGCDYVVNNAVPGSGFFTPINGYNFLGAAVLYTLIQPDVIFVAGNYNDNGSTGVTSAQRQAATLAYLTAMRTAYPNAMIVIYGPWGGQFNGNAVITTCEADMATAITQFGDANVFFIPLIARSPAFAWVTGTGKISAPSGQGNADSYVWTDGTHPICIAHKEYIPRVYAEGFRALINSLSA